MKSAVFAIIPSATQAEAIVEELQLSGFSNRDISVLFPDVEGSREFAHTKGTKALGGAVIGGGAEGVFGGLAGWLLGAGVLAIPGAGPLWVAGPLLTILSGTVIGAAAGGMSGALAGLGFLEHEARLFEGEFRDGNILIAAHAENPHERIVARQTFERGNAHDINVTTKMAVPAY